MYTLERVTLENQSKYIILHNNNFGNTLKIAIDHGAAIHQLHLNNKTIIKEFDSKNCNEKFFSSILFPYVNRVDEGRFVFQENTYNLPLNDTKEQQAIHGLVYNKKFDLIACDLFNEHAIVKLSHSEAFTKEGLPFNYKIDLTYQINQTSLSLKVDVHNKGIKPFPFGLGWHPYFHNETKENFTLKFKSNQKVEFNNQMIPISFRNIETNELIINKRFDDCYRLKKGEVTSNSGNYNLQLTSSAKVNYLQIYTPKNTNSVAIEFMTSPPNSFNNKVDLNILAPKKHYSVTWSIKI